MTRVPPGRNTRAHSRAACALSGKWGKAAKQMTWWKVALAKGSRWASACTSPEAMGLRAACWSMAMEMSTATTRTP